MTSKLSKMVNDRSETSGRCLKILEQTVRVVE